jgi:UDP-glucose 4-epimerase
MLDPAAQPRALVTGGAGFIGSALVAALLDGGVDVTVADLVPHPDERVVSIVGDIAEAPTVERAFASIPNVVFHLAARTSVLQSVRDPIAVYEVNVAATQRLLEAARDATSEAFVFASTNAVVGETNGAVITERSALRPLTPYGATKAAAEMLCSAYAASYGFAITAVRLTNVYGPGMQAKDTFVVRLLRAAAARGVATIYGDGLQLRDYVFVDDAVAGLLLAWTKGIDGPLVIGSGVSTSVNEVCELARGATRVPFDITHVPAPRGEMRAVRVDIAHARGQGFAPRVDLPEGLARTWAALEPHLVPDRPDRS